MLEANLEAAQGAREVAMLKLHELEFHGIRLTLTEAHYAQLMYAQLIDATHSVTIAFKATRSETSPETLAPAAVTATMDEAVEVRNVGHGGLGVSVGDHADTIT